MTESARRENSTVSNNQAVIAFHKEVKRRFKGNYLLYLPPGYKESQQTWPTIFFLHGAGERGHDPELIRRHGVPKIIEEQPGFPFIVISPQCPANRWWSLEWLDALFDEALVQYRIDLKRIYLTGLSMGGFATWAWAIEQPERFAALAPVCGGGNPLEAPKIKDIPVWAFHGARDDVVPLRKSKEMIAARKACGGAAKLTVYPNAGHDSWTAAYANPKLYEWFLKHKRP